MLTSLTKKEELNIQTNAEKQNNSNSTLVEIDNIEGTPFKMVTTEEGSFAAYGNNRITDYMDKEELIKKIEQKDWNLLGTFVISIINSYNQFKKENNE